MDEVPLDHAFPWFGSELTARLMETLDFCLRVTQRRSRAQTDLTADGADAQQWLDIARVFL